MRDARFSSSRTSIDAHTQTKIDAFFHKMAIHDRVSIREALYRVWCGVNRLSDSGMNRLGDTSAFVKEALYRIWGCVNRLGDSGVNILGVTSAFVKGALYRIWCGVNRLGDSGVKVV